MNRRKFLKLMAGVLAGLGLKISSADDCDTSQVIDNECLTGKMASFSLSATPIDDAILKDYWPMADSEILCASHGDCPECPSLERCPWQFKSYRPLLIEYFASNPVSYAIQFEAEA